MVRHGGSIAADGTPTFTALKALYDTYAYLLTFVTHVISLLVGLGHMASLMELYMNNNRIMSMKELNPLRGNDKLIILDLSGNAMCQDKEYRLYTIYHMKKLKVSRVA